MLKLILFTFLYKNISCIKLIIIKFQNSTIQSTKLFSSIIMNPITVKLNALKIFIILCILLLVLFLLKVYFSSDEDDEISYTENPLLNKLKKIELENKSSDSNDIEKILAPILAASDDQLLIDPKVILTTIRFMLEERDEDDPELIEFVRSLIVRPDPEKKLVLKDKSKYNSSHTTSSQYVHETLKGKRDGFFIEAGAHEGEDISNTLFFEIERGWTGKETISIIYASLILTLTQSDDFKFIKNILIFMH